MDGSKFVNLQPVLKCISTYISSDHFSALYANKHIHNLCLQRPNALLSLAGLTMTNYPIVNATVCVYERQRGGGAQ